MKICGLIINIFPKGKEVVIVGGGVSGLAAASHLCQNGICNITILEAGDRLGGRLRSDQFHGVLIQRGAQFIHGQTNNPVYDVGDKLIVYSLQCIVIIICHIHSISPPVICEVGIGNVCHMLPNPLDLDRECTLAYMC